MEKVYRRLTFWPAFHRLSNRSPCRRLGEGLTDRAGGGPDVALLEVMKRIILAAMCAALVSACSTSAKTPDVSKSIRDSLDQSGFKAVSVSQDRDKGVITLSGHVPSDADKAQAESVAKGLAGGQVVADQIIVEPPGNESDAKSISSALDSGIEDNLKASFKAHHVADSVSYSSKAGVVTLTGSVDSDATRKEAAKLASQVPNVTQVINELTVKK